MTRVVVGALMVAWALAGWRNMPRLEDPQASAAGTAVAVSVLAAWWLGRRSVRASAVAAAVASAVAAAEARSQATAAAQASVVVNLATGARQAAARDYGGLDAAPWIVSGQTVPELEGEALDSALEDVLDRAEEYERP